MSELHQIERLQQQDWPRLKSLRLSSVVDAPGAFGSSLEAMSAREDAFWSGQVESMACFVAHRLSPEGREDLGLVRGAIDPKTPEQAWLLGMWVDPIARGLGLGERLGQAVLDWAQQLEEVTLVQLEVHHSNRPAIALYERLGFRAAADGQGEGGELPERGVYQYLL